MYRYKSHVALEFTIFRFTSNMLVITTVNILLYSIVKTIVQISSALTPHTSRDNLNSNLSTAMHFHSFIRYLKFMPSVSSFFRLVTMSVRYPL